MRVSALGRIARAFIVAQLCASHWACDTLKSDAGDDFQVVIATPMPIEIYQRQEPLPVTFRVPDCTDFEVSFKNTSQVDCQDRTSVTTEWPLTYEAQEDNTFVATVPMHYLLDRGCRNIDEATASYALVVRCGEDDRTREAPLSVRYKLAWSAGFVMDTAHLFDSGDSAVGLAFGNGVLESFKLDEGDDAWIREMSLPSESGLSVPRFARSTHRAFFSTGCPFPPACEDIEIPTDVGNATVSVPTSYVYAWTRGPYVLPELPGKTYEIAGHLEFMAVDAQERLVVVSNSYDPAQPWLADSDDHEHAGLIVTRYDDVGQPTRTFISGMLTHSYDFGWRSDGALVFVAKTLDSRDAYLVVDDGATVTTTAFEEPEWTSDASHSDLISVSPEGLSLVTSRRGQTWIKAGDEGWTRLDSTMTVAQAKWSDSLLFLLNFWSSDTGTSDTGSPVEAFERSGAHAVRFRYVPPEVEKWDIEIGELVEIGVLDDKVVLKSSTGVRVLDDQGTNIAGLDPVAPGSFASFAITGTTVLTGAEGIVYALDLSGAPPREAK